MILIIPVNNGKGRKIGSSTQSSVKKSTIINSRTYHVPSIVSGREYLKKLLNQSSRFKQLTKYKSTSRFSLLISFF